MNAELKDAHEALQAVDLYACSPTGSRYVVGFASHDGEIYLPTDTMVLRRIRAPRVAAAAQLLCLRLPELPEEDLILLDEGAGLWLLGEEAKS